MADRQAIEVRCLKAIAWIAVAAVLPLSVLAKEKPRPRILAILQVRVLTTNEKQAHSFYYGILRTLALANGTATKCDWCEQIVTDSNGPIVLDSISGPLPKDFIGGVVFKTDDADGLCKFLEKNKVKVEKLKKWTSGDAFAAFDPEGHQLIFVQPPDPSRPTLNMPGAYAPPSSHWPHVIHAGFVVHDPAATDHFYRDILGFHVYWQGGMKDGETDWVDMQVPDGTDWIEYMLNVPDNADQQLRGVMNHIALGVPDIKGADQQLLESDLHLSIGEAPQIGRDGKWQLNLYDPDGTRIELMEFIPVEKPCCSEYTGPHPKP